MCELFVLPWADLVWVLILILILILFLSERKS